jgi:tetratricopeptide (TPR) repeat protein
MSGEMEVQKAYESILGQHFEQAAEWFLKAIDRDPNNPDYHYKLSITYARSNKLEDALQYAENALQLDPGNATYEIQVRALRARLLCREAEVILDQGHVGDVTAIFILRQAIQLDPLAEGAYVLLAAVYGATERYTEAIATLRELLDLDPEHPTAPIMLNNFKQKLELSMEDHP